MLEFWCCNSTNRHRIALFNAENISGICGWCLTLIAFSTALTSRSRLFMGSVRLKCKSAICLSSTLLASPLITFFDSLTVLDSCIPITQCLGFVCRVRVLQKVFDFVDIKPLKFCHLFTSRATVLPGQSSQLSTNESSSSSFSSSPGRRTKCNGSLPLSLAEASQALRRPDPLPSTVDRYRTNPAFRVLKDCIFWLVGPM